MSAVVATSPIRKPERPNLIAQTVNAIRESILAGSWDDRLPGERELCRLLQISRPTLRAALQILAREGFIAINPGKRSSILSDAPAIPCSSARSCVALVSKLPLHLLSRNRLFLVDYLQRVLQEQGLDLEIVTHPAFGTQRPAAALNHLAERGSYKAFVLLTCSREVQNWFGSQSLPAITLGSVFPGIPLPSIDVDYKSIGHHAAGIFLGNGHRSAVWIVPEARHAGNIETEESFTEAFNNSHHKPEPCRIIRCTASRDSLIQKLGQLPAGPRAPTAFFVMESFATTTLVTYLLERGRSIPADASIITRDYDELLRWISPDIAHYMPPLRRIAARISRMVVDIVGGIPLPIDPVRMMPDFRKGHSVGRCRESPKSLKRSSLAPPRPRGAKPPSRTLPYP